MALEPVKELSSFDQVDVLCDEFERRSRCGDRPRLDEFVSTSIGADIETLLPELVALDVELRLERGEQPTLADYDAVIGNDELRSSVSSEIEFAFERWHIESAPLPRMLGRYRLESMIGRGTFGEVYRAYDTVLDRTVAVKTLRSDRRLQPQVVQHLLSEARNQAGLSHTAVVPVLDYGETPECYIVTEWIDGETLAQFAKRCGTVDVEQAVRIVTGVAGALDAAQRKGLVHRDVKPSNILLNRCGEPLLTDFGLAAAEEHQLDEPTATIGTFAYMSPEQVRGENRTVDGRSDIYSLGVITYQLLTGRLPIVARSRDEWREQIESREPRPLRTIVPAVPRELDEAVLKSLSKRAADRYATAGDFAAALRKATRGPRLPWRAPVALVAAMVAMLGILWLWPGADVVLAITDLGRQHPGLRSVEGHYPVAPIVTDAQSGTNLWSITDKGRAIMAQAPTEAMLLAVDDYQGGSMEFDAILQQSAWEGGIGIFFGMRRPIDPEDLSFKSMTFNRGINGRPKLSINSYRRMFHNSFDDLAKTPSGGVRLRFRIDEGSLTYLQFGDQDCTSLVDKFNADMRIWEARDGHTSDCRGTFGFYCVRSSSVFKDAHINGVDVHFVRADIE